jgi:hypothetical protein
MTSCAQVVSLRVGPQAMRVVTTGSLTRLRLTLRLGALVTLSLGIMMSGSSVDAQVVSPITQALTDMYNSMGIATATAAHTFCSGTGTCRDLLVTHVPVPAQPSAWKVSPVTLIPEAVSRE